MGDQSAELLGVGSTVGHLDENDVRALVGQVFDGIDLDDDQREKAQEILGDFYQENFTAWRNGDTKLQRELKNDAEKRLKKVVGHTKAKKIMNNVNRGMGGRRGGGR